MTQASAPRPLPSLAIVPYPKVRRSDLEGRDIVDSLAHELSAALVAQGMQATVHRTDVILFPEPPNGYIRPEPARELARAAGSDMVVVVRAWREGSRRGPLALAIDALNPSTGLPGLTSFLDGGDETDAREEMREVVAPRLVDFLLSRT